MVRPGIALYGGNPTPGSPIRCGRWSTLKARVLQVRDVGQGRHRRLWRDLDRQARQPDRRRSPRAMPTASCAPQRSPKAPSRPRGAGGRQALPHRRPRLDGSDGASTSPTCRTARSRRDQMVTLIGDGLSRRRGRGAGRHHCLRGADQPRPALSTGSGRPDVPFQLMFLKCSPAMAMVPYRIRRIRQGRMSRRNLTFVCQNCGAAYGRWQGKCEACGEWNTLVEEGDGTGGSPAVRPARAGAPRKGRPVRARAAGRRDPRRPSPALRHRRTRSRHRRRLRARLGAAAWPAIPASANRRC